MNATLPSLNFLTSSSAFADYRPAIGPGGDVVIFERTPVISDPPSPPTVLYAITDLSNPQPTPFLLSGSSLPQFQTRPDFCWNTGDIAFNGGTSSEYQFSLGVWKVGADGADAQSIPNTVGCAYPAWSLDGSLFVTENCAPGVTPKPCNTVFDTGGDIPPNGANIDGTDADGVAVYGGMPTVGPNSLPQIAFAGQPAVAGWGGSNSYNENFNYIFLNSEMKGVYSSKPMEPDTSIQTYESNYQGRAPAWSPDGTAIAFESDRIGSGYAIYLCDLASGTITQVTDPDLGGQHAKFFPCGTKLILTIHHPGGTPTTRGIAWVDISGLLKSQSAQP